MSEKILYVDDEEDVELLIKRFFRREIENGSLDFVFATDGAEALKMLKEDRKINIVLSDINMPNMDGLELLHEIGELKRPLLHTVLVTAYGDMSNIRMAMNRGAFDFLTKPIDMKDLKITIERAIQSIEQKRLERDEKFKLENDNFRLVMENDKLQRDILCQLGTMTNNAASKKIRDRMDHIENRMFNQNQNDIEIKKIFKWDDDYKIGIDAIDVQHKWFFDEANKIYSMIEAARKDNSMDIDDDLDQHIRHLVVFTMNHFTEEESLMESLDYPLYDVHKMKHDEMRAMIDRVADKSDFDKIKFLKLVIDWEINHMRVSDKQLIVFFKQNN